MFQLGKFDSSKRGEDEIKAALTGLISGIEVGDLYSRISEEFKSVINSKDYSKLLSIYNRKSLSAQISSDVGLANGKLPETVLSLLRGGCATSIRNALAPYFGDFRKYIEE